MDLRLFPLNAVLLPGMRMPLHIFEERYRIMIRECIEEEAPFGVLLIKAGGEASGSTVPHDVGTTAHILQVEHLEDGRMNIFTIGQDRFRIVAVNTTQPYLRGEVTILDQEPSTDSAYAALPRAREMFDDYLRTYLALADEWMHGISLPDDPAEAADYIAARMDIGPDAKQELLAQLNPEVRLHREMEILGEVLPDMHGRLVAHLRRKASGFAVLN